MSRGSSQNLVLTVVLGLIVLALAMVASPWEAGAQGTDDSGGVVTGPPADGSSQNINDEHGTVNVNPEDGDPFVQVGGEVAEYTPEDDEGSMTGAVAFEVSHSSFAFSGLVSGASTFVLNKWLDSGIDTGDFDVVCLNSTSEVTGANVRIDSKSAQASGASDFTYSISGRVDQHGTCILAFRSGDVGDEGSISNADLAAAGIEN